MREAIPREKLPELLKQIREAGKTIVTTNGCFDILHVGHVRYLEETKKYGDILIVALNSDESVRRLKGEGRPINNERDRAEVLNGLKSVDYVVIFDEDSPAALLSEIKPNVHTKGADYTVETLPEAKVIIDNGGRLEFISFVEGKSTTNTIKKINEQKEEK
jgi:rfaE bifunctional protein nucleotidyltransferase chain/domain